MSGTNNIKPAWLTDEWWEYGRIDDTSGGNLGVSTTIPSFDTVIDIPKNDGYIPYKDTAAGKLSYDAYLNDANAYKSIGPFNFSQNDKFLDVQRLIEGYKPFEYDINDDALYQQYVDQYVNMGKLASQDVMGQAAALTGGYGNSYAQGVSQQQYNAYLQQLNELAPEFEERAYNRHMQGLKDLYNEYALLSAEREREFSDYESILNDAYRDMIVAGDIFKNEESAYNNAFSINNAPSNNATETSTHGIYTGGGELDGTTVPTYLLNTRGLTTTEAKYFDENGYFKNAEYRTAKDGLVTFNIGGKEVTVEENINPYNGKYNPDCEHGTFGLGPKGKTPGYQPNNITDSSGTPHYLKGTGEHEYVNGVKCQIFVFEDGSDDTEWVWDGTKNKYIPLDPEEDTTNKKEEGN